MSAFNANIANFAFLKNSTGCRWEWTSHSVPDTPKIDQFSNNVRSFYFDNN